jgi:hypothetical protein
MQGFPFFQFRDVESVSLADSSTFQRNLRLFFLLYWMKPLITPRPAWLARA